MSDSEDKTEEPSSRRLAKAREEGDVAISLTLTTAIGFGSTLVALWLLVDLIMERLSSLLSKAFSSAETIQTNSSLLGIVVPMLLDSLIIIAYLLATLLVASTLTGLLQTRGMLSMKRLSIDLSHMNPAEQISQLFSTMKLFELVKTVIKFVLIIGALYLITRSSISDLVSTMSSPNLWAGVLVVSKYIFLMAIVATLIYLVMGFVDYGHQYFEFIKRNRMSKFEVKQEARDIFGDPHINSYLREQRNSMIMGSQLPKDATPTLIVTNPTHFAVALFYEAGVVDLPIVVGKARNKKALQMRAHALEQGIPVAERPPLARRLYRTLAVGQAIRQDDLENVAEVFRWLKQAESSARKP